MKLLTPAQAAEILQVTTPTVYNWLNRRHLPGAKIGGVWRVRLADIQRITNPDGAATTPSTKLKEGVS